MAWRAAATRVGVNEPKREKIIINESSPEDEKLIGRHK